MNDTELSFEDLHELPEVGKGCNDNTVGGIVLFSEDCPKCGGTGSWRPGYPCFKCKGKGKLEFKTSPEMRIKARKYAKKAKAKKAEDTKAFWAEYLEARPAIKEWFELKLLAGSSFAQSLTEGGVKYGQLTEGQENAVLKNIAEMDDAKLGFEKWCEGHEGVLEWLQTEVANGNRFAGSLLDQGMRKGFLTDPQLALVVEKLDEAATVLAQGELDLSPLMKGYYAVPEGETRLKVAVRRPGKNSRWHGWTFVDDGAAYGSRQNYGRQAPDGLYQGKIQLQLRAILDNPQEAMVAYGKLTGTCGKCGRILEDPESIAAGIGPICAESF